MRYYRHRRPLYGFGLSKTRLKPCILARQAAGQLRPLFPPRSASCTFRRRHRRAAVRVSASGSRCQTRKEVYDDTIRRRCMRSLRVFARSRLGVDRGSTFLLRPNDLDTFQHTARRPRSTQRSRSWMGVRAAATRLLEAARGGRDRGLRRSGVKQSGRSLPRRLTERKATLTCSLPRGALTRLLKQEGARELHCRLAESQGIGIVKSAGVQYPASSPPGCRSPAHLNYNYDPAHAGRSWSEVGRIEARSCRRHEAMRLVDGRLPVPRCAIRSVVVRWVPGGKPGTCARGNGIEHAAPRRPARLPEARCRRTSRRLGADVAPRGIRSKG